MPHPEVTVGADGWVTVRIDDQHTCRVRFAPGRGGHRVITDVHVQGPEVTPALLRSIPLARIEAAMIPRDDIYDVPDYDYEEYDDEYYERTQPPTRITTPRERPRLTRPNGIPPQTFYPAVANAYLEYAPRTKAPAKAIATEAGVPVTTAHRWVREARRLGFLPPGRKGKVG